MSPSELSWIQGCLFLFLGVAGGVAGGYSLNRCQNRRTSHGTSHVELSSIRVENEITTTPFDDAESSGGDEEARSPSTLSTPVGEATAFTRSPSRPSISEFPLFSHLPVVEDTSRELTHAKRFNGVRYRPFSKNWVAEMRPPKYKNKASFGDFESEAEAARAVDAAFHHYGKPELLNFPDTSLQFLSTRPTAPAGLDERAKMKFVKEEARLMAAIPSSHANLGGVSRCD